MGGVGPGRPGLVLPAVVLLIGFLGGCTSEVADVVAVDAPEPEAKDREPLEMPRGVVLDDPGVGQLTPAPTEDVAVGSAPAGGLCDGVDPAAVAELIGRQPDSTTSGVDACSYTAIDGDEVTIVSTTRTQWVAAASLADVVSFTAGEVDADGAPEPVDVGDEALVLTGDTGTYLHVVAAGDYLLVYVDGVDDQVAVATGMARLLLG